MHNKSVHQQKYNSTMGEVNFD